MAESGDGWGKVGYSEKIVKKIFMLFYIEEEVI